jgi:hypothetical protein
VRADSHRQDSVNILSASRPARSGRSLRGLDLRSLAADAAATCGRRPGIAMLTVGLIVTAVSSVLEFLNPGNYWLLFEDISCAVAPMAAAAAALAKICFG